MSARNALPGIPLVESPIFPVLANETPLTNEERRIGRELHERGFAIIDFPDPDIGERVERIKRRLAPRFGIDPDNLGSLVGGDRVRRVQDAWLEDDDVRAIAANPEMLLCSNVCTVGRPSLSRR